MVAIIDDPEYIKAVLADYELMCVRDLERKWEMPRSGWFYRRDKWKAQGYTIPTAYADKNKEGGKEVELTEVQALDYSIKIWEELVKTGDWGKYRVAEKYGNFRHGCPLCELAGENAGSHSTGGCAKCPYYQEFGACENKGSSYYLWHGAISNDERISHARDFLSQLLYLRHKLGEKGCKVKVETTEKGKDKRPEPKFKVGDRVEGTDGCFKGEIGTIKSLYFGYGDCWYYEIDESTASEEYLTLAPEWEDVTKECTVELCNDYVRVVHEGLFVLGLAGGYSALTSNANYRVEVHGSGSESVGSFKILKRT